MDLQKLVFRILYEEDCELEAACLQKRQQPSTVTEIFLLRNSLSKVTGDVAASRAVAQLCYFHIKRSEKELAQMLSDNSFF